MSVSGHPQRFGNVRFSCLFFHFGTFVSGKRIAITVTSFDFNAGALAMLGVLTNIPTDTLIDMLYIIIAGEITMSSREAMEIEQIQRELQRRDGERSWNFGMLN